LIQQGPSNLIDIIQPIQGMTNFMELRKFTFAEYNMTGSAFINYF